MNTANKGSSYASALLTPVCLQLSPPSHQLMRGGTIAEPREVWQLCRTEASVCGGGRPRGASFLCKLHPLFVQNNGLEVLLVSIKQILHAAWVLHYVRTKILETQLLSSC